MKNSTKERLREAMLLYAVTDANINPLPLISQVEAAINGGAAMIQFRDKSADDEAFIALARSIGALCKRRRVLFIVNDRVDLAMECGADGVHIGQSDGDARAVRKKIGAEMILGVSVQTRAQALLAEESGADYLGVGAMFATSTKPDADIVSIPTLKAICGAVDIPVAAIGGITRHNISLLRNTGISGAALVSAVFASDDITLSAQNMRSLIQDTIQRRKISGAIFDMDGTILDSMPRWETVGRDFLINAGKTPRDDLRDVMRVMSVAQAAEYFITDYGVPFCVQDIINGINSLMQYSYMHEFKLKSGALRLLDRLRALKVRMCVATATDRHLAEAALKRNGVLEYFEAVFTCGEVGAAKDEPVIFQTALDFLCTDMDSTYVFEDALFAIKTAAKAGFKTAAVYDDSARAQAEQISGTAEIYATLEEMRNIF